jgi:hypothetical protein
MAKATIAIVAISVVDRFDAVPVFVPNFPSSIPAPIPDRHNPAIAIPADMMNEGVLCSKQRW